ncbi:heavy-metal-associated domain-containing protein [Loktanella sp. M215]|uniref:heavy-metal-associated domain-containing protein n=1 Tax=Loktanella sp. M215 TaxID=2675431 RepID=UPI001F1B1F41|nr:heavy-metal-associated domain-containing protein [Loktanella sp. M215]MCF7699264.1 copper chaperone [Loktanella sp. M215]
MTTYSIPDMSCGHCKATIEKTVHGLDPAATLTFDMPARTVQVQSGTDDARLQQALAAEGYPATPV